MGILFYMERARMNIDRKKTFAIEVPSPGNPKNSPGKNEKITLKEWVKRAEMLWSLLDDIDTMDDIARDRDKYFRDAVRVIVDKRFKVFNSDGYKLYPVHKPDTT